MVRAGLSVDNASRLCTALRYSVVLPASRSWRPRASHACVTTAVIAFAALGFAGASSAAAGDEPSPGASSVTQYVELVPTAGGPKAPGVEKERRLPLSPEAKRALGRVSKATAASLLTIATSSTYGAPSGAGTRAAGRLVRDARPTAPSPSLQAIAGAVAPAGDARMIALLVLLVAVTLAGGALSLRPHP